MSNMGDEIHISLGENDSLVSSSDTDDEEKGVEISVIEEEASSSGKRFAKSINQ